LVLGGGGGGGYKIKMRLFSKAAEKINNNQGKTSIFMQNQFSINSIWFFGVTLKKIL